MIKDFLLPETDGLVAIQLAATILAGSGTLVILILRGQRDIAWLVAGSLAMWLAFAGFRALH